MVNDSLTMWLHFPSQNTVYTVQVVLWQIDEFSEFLAIINKRFFPAIHKTVCLDQALISACLGFPFQLTCCPADVAVCDINVRDKATVTPCCLINVCGAGTVRSWWGIFAGCGGIMHGCWGGGLLIIFVKWDVPSAAVMLLGLFTFASFELICDKI